MTVSPRAKLSPSVGVSMTHDGGAFSPQTSIVTVAEACLPRLSSTMALSTWLPSARSTVAEYEPPESVVAPVGSRTVSPSSHVSTNSVGSSSVSLTVAARSMGAAW